ncbi:phosphohydrolase [Clostridium swellfunianum]|uniref:phosphohydrolase n=1 Tax=Clostridium swellfunianum TaxID=1367462 RepID=UPI0020303D96|nr:phosphohydrolase [Clostridium swellfunianum]MCM0648155.1 phosphohydrolase [Clostridium swellfunianum]
MKCFYHDDPDGFCAAYWVASSVAVNDSYKDAPEFYEISYRVKFPLDIIRAKEQIYIVDYSISPEEMRELLKITDNVTWIDHHKTAIEKYESFEHDIRGLRYDGISACLLAYCYVKHMTASGEGNIKPFDKSMIDDAPMFTKLISDSDILAFKYGDDTKNFFTAFGAYDFKPQSKKWTCFTKDNSFELKMIEEGKLLSLYEKAAAKHYLRLGFETILEGHKCFAVNYGYSGIDFFDSLPEGLYDIFISFAFDGFQHVVSLYSRTVDVSCIATKYGGGGHKMAAGFQCEKLPFIRVEKGRERN